MGKKKSETESKRREEQINLAAEILAAESTVFPPEILLLKAKLMKKSLSEGAVIARVEYIGDHTHLHVMQPLINRAVKLAMTGHETSTQRSGGGTERALKEETRLKSTLALIAKQARKMRAKSGKRLTLKDLIAAKDEVVKTQEASNASRKPGDRRPVDARLVGERRLKKIRDEINESE